MTIVIEASKKPIALIVEDNKEYLEEFRDMCKHAEYQPIAVTTYDDAYREFRATPAIDVVFTDVNLDPDDRNDQSGLRLAVEIKRQRPGIHVIGISGRFGEGEMPEVDRAAFSAFIQKAEGYDKTLDFIKQWKPKALEYRRSRIEQSKKDVEKLHKVYKLNRGEGARVADEPVPADPPTQDSDHGGNVSDWLKEERGEGFGFQSDVAAGYTLEDDAGTPARTIAPIELWLLEEDGYFVAELRNHAMLYAESDTKDDAIHALILLMLGCHNDFERRAGMPFGPALAPLRDHLKSIFG